MKNLYLPRSVNWKHSAFLAFIFCSIASLLLCFFVLPAATSFAAASPSPEHYMEEGLRSFQQGDFQDAVLQWSEAARIYQKDENPGKQTEALTRLSQAYQSAGHYEKAREHLEDALVLAKASGDQMSIARVLGRLGDVYLATGPQEKANHYLSESLGIARKLGNPQILAVILNNNGNLLSSQAKYQEALAAYKESSLLAEANGNRSLEAVSLTNAATAATHNKKYEEARAFLDRALEGSKGLAQSHDKAFGLINIGLAYHTLRQHIPDAQNKLTLLAFEALNEAVTVAEEINDYGAASYAWGYVGTLYEDEGRYDEALEATRRASFAAQHANASESLYRWEWQRGRVHKALGNIDEAVASYRRAIDTLQSLRQEMATVYGGGQSSFRETVGPLYFELVDLLLQQAASLKEPEHYEPYLIEARETIELLKLAELRDYFQDECVDAARSSVTTLDVVSQTAVVIYPVLLPDRIELLVSLPSGLKRFSTPVTAEALTGEVRKFRRLLEKRTSREYLLYARKLYDLLIRPLEPDLMSLSVETLVFVPDGPLRTIPMAALHDGKQFLVEKFAVAITPGLNLTDPQPIKRDTIKILALGLTESSQGFPPLPYVAEELKDIQSLFGGTVLLNQDFLLSSVSQNLADEPFTIVHIASHGQFESEVEKTFLLTFDDKLTMNRLDQCVGLFRFRDDPLELLTLSACQTAAGDDRAALGLAGIAIKAGARSAFATLWYINDQASSLLVGEFYRQLQDPLVSRAAALQRAQLKLLNDPRYQHPGYWSPFLLINNWL